MKEQECPRCGARAFDNAVRVRLTKAACVPDAPVMLRCDRPVEGGTLYRSSLDDAVKERCGKVWKPVGSGS